MRKPNKQYDSFSIKYGSLRMQTHTIGSTTYREGVYFHPKGVVVVTVEDSHTRADTSYRGRHYICTVPTPLMDNEIKHFCRKFLLEIVENNIQL